MRKVYMPSWPVTATKPYGSRRTTTFSMGFPSLSLTTPVMVPNSRIASAVEMSDQKANRSAMIAATHDVRLKLFISIPPKGNLLLLVPTLGFGSLERPLAAEMPPTITYRCTSIAFHDNPLGIAQWRRIEGILQYSG